MANHLETLRRIKKKINPLGSWTQVKKKRNNNLKINVRRLSLGDYPRSIALASEKVLILIRRPWSKKKKWDRSGPVHIHKIFKYSCTQIFPAKLLISNLGHRVKIELKKNITEKKKIQMYTAYDEKI